MKMENELMLLRHIVETYGHLDFDEIKNDAMYMDCVMMEHSIRDGTQAGEVYGLRELKKQHYMFRAFFDKQNKWWDYFVDENFEEPVGVKEDFDLDTELEE